MTRQRRRWRLVRARGEAATPSRRRGGQNLPRRVPLLVAAGVAIAGLVAWLVLGTSALGVRQVEVTGSQLAPPEVVRAVADVSVGTPLARVDLDGVAERVRGLPSVASVTVSRSWPSTLVIAVTERVAAGAVATVGGFALVDPTGVVFHTVPNRPPEVLLLGLGAPSPRDPATLAALEVVAALTPQLRAVTAEVRAESATRLRVLLADGRLIIWGDSSASADKARVATALLGQAATVIDVSAPNVATTS